ncbi:MAG: helix-turn-helix domain-containing protein [Pirellulaceae bacterium]
MPAILLTVDEAADILRMTPRRLTRMANRGDVPRVDLGDGDLRFAREDLEAWAASCKQPAKGATDAT